MAVDGLEFEPFLLGFREVREWVLPDYCADDRLDYGALELVQLVRIDVLGNGVLNDVAAQ